MSAIFRGGSGWSGSAYYQAGPGVALGDNLGFWTAWLGVFPSGAPTATRQFASALGGVGGWDMRITGAMSALTWRMYDTTPNGVTYTSSILAAADLDRLQMYVALWDGPAQKQRAFWKRAEVGTGTSRAGYQPSPTETLRIGGVPAEPTTAGDLVQTYGFAYGLGVLTLAEVQALYDAVMANERMMGVPGKTDHLFDFTADSLSGALPPTFTDKQGSAVLTKNGAPVYSERFARSWGW